MQADWNNLMITSWMKFDGYRDARGRCLEYIHDVDIWPDRHVMTILGVESASKIEIVYSSTRIDADGGPNCCRRCERHHMKTPLDRRLILCSKCGNKRCPKATFHENACTMSNEPGQPGSEYT